MNDFKALATSYCLGFELPNPLFNMLGSFHCERQGEHLNGFDFGKKGKKSSNPQTIKLLRKKAIKSAKSWSGKEPLLLGKSHGRRIAELTLGPQGSLEKGRSWKWELWTGNGWEKEKIVGNEWKYARKKYLQELWNQIPREGCLHTPTHQVERMKWKISSSVWLIVEGAAMDEEGESECVTDLNNLRNLFFTVWKKIFFMCSENSSFSQPHP